MLKMLTPKDVLTTWGSLKEAIKVSLPPTVTNANENLEFVKSSLVMGKRQAWVSFTEDKKLNAVLVTEFVGEEGLSERNLLIYAITKLALIHKEDWEIGLDLIKKFAIKNECKAILAFTNQDAIVKLAQDKLNAKAEYMLLKWEV